MLRKTILIAGASLLATLSLGATARAQTLSNIGTFVAFPGASRGHNVSVLERERPEYDAPGLRAGAFQVLPRIEVTPSTTDNVFAAETNEQSDIYLDLRPSVSVSSDWSRHALNFNAGALSRSYSDFSSQSYDNWNVDASGRLEVTADSYFAAGAELKQDHVAPDSISYPNNALEPIPFLTKDGFLRGVFQANRVRLVGNVLFAKVDFDDVPAAGGGVVDQDGRDFDQTAVTVRGDYALSPDTALFIEARHGESSYDNLSTSGAKRDSSQSEVLFGANFDLTSLMRGEIGVGYLRREYDDPTFPKISGGALRGQLEYFPTPLTTITLSARRAVEDAILANAGGYLSTYGSARIDHELLRNLLLYGQFGYENADFRGVNREDKISDFSLGATYLVNRYVGLSGGYTYRNRESSGVSTGPSFNLNKFAVTLTLRR